MKKRVFDCRGAALVALLLLGGAVAARAATVNGCAWAGSHWDTPQKTAWYTTCNVTGLGLTESISDVNVVVKHDHDDDAGTPIEWEEFTLAMGPKSSNHSTGPKIGSMQGYAVYGYDNHHHPSVMGSSTKVKVRVYLSGNPNPIDGPEYDAACN